MLSRTPPMGWNSWNTFGSNINEQLIRDMADFFVEEGLKDAGYEYIIIDDCWALPRRVDGKLVPDPEKFPSGMKALSDYIHSKGLKFGMYSCAGTRTCAGQPGSYDYEYTDAETFAEWGVDYLKYDYCYLPTTADGKLCYKRMGMALRATGREILFSACNWGEGDCGKWMRSVGAHMWRSTGDIVDNWNSIKNLTMQQLPKINEGAMGSFNDMDMLVCGMYGKGNAALGGCTDEEYKTHFTIWALLNSPLIIGCDVRNMSEETRKILLDKDVIAINQDPECRQPYLASSSQHDPENQKLVFIKPMAENEYAIGFFNFTDEKSSVQLNLCDVGLAASSGYSFKLYDVWAKEDAGVFKDWVSPILEKHACVLYRARLVKD